MQANFDPAEIDNLAAELSYQWIEDLFRQNTRYEARKKEEDEQRQREMAQASRPQKLSRRDADQLFAQYFRPKPPMVIKRKGHVRP